MWKRQSPNGVLEELRNDKVENNNSIPMGVMVSTVPVHVSSQFFSASESFVSLILAQRSLDLQMKNERVGHHLGRILFRNVKIS